MLGKTFGDVGEDNWEMLGKTGTLGKTLKAIGEDIKEDPQHPQVSSPTSQERHGRHVFPNISGKDREDLTSPTSQGR